MKRSRFVAAVVALSAIVTLPLAYAGGLWFGIPVLGGGTYCQQNLAGASGQAGGTAQCTATSPAGPTGMTGFELFPVDTDVNGSQATYPLPIPAANSAAAQTVYVPAANVASGAYQNVALLTPSVTFTATINNGVNTVYVNATGTQTYVGFIMPSTPTDGQIIRFAAAATVSAVGLSVGSGVAALQSIQTTTRVFALYPAGYGGGASANVTGPFGFTMLYNLSSNTWWRVQ